MQTLATGKDDERDARAALGELPAAAEVGVSAAAGNVQAAGAGEREGAERAAIVACFPCRTVSGLNVREHWAVKARRAKQHRGEAFMRLRSAALGHPVPCTVTLTRIAPRALDGDNLQASLKNVRDGVADFLKVDDRDPRVTWSYAQRRGAAKEYAVEVQIA